MRAAARCIHIGKCMHIKWYIWYMSKYSFRVCSVCLAKDPRRCTNTACTATSDCSTYAAVAAADAVVQHRHPANCQSSQCRCSPQNVRFMFRETRCFIRKQISIEGCAVVRVQMIRNLLSDPRVPFLLRSRRISKSKSIACVAFVDGNSILFQLQSKNSSTPLLIDKRPGGNGDGEKKKPQHNHSTNRCSAAERPTRQPALKI